MCTVCDEHVCLLTATHTRVRGTLQVDSHGRNVAVSIMFLRGQEFPYHTEGCDSDETVQAAPPLTLAEAGLGWMYPGERVGWVIAPG
jgi:hypothetical protein